MLTSQDKIDKQKRLLAGWGVSSIAELKALPEYVKAVKESGGDELKAVQKMFVRKETVTQTGWFLRTDTYTEKDSTGEHVIKDYGPVILFPDGTSKTFWNKQELELSPLTPVKIGPLHRVQNFDKGTVGQLRSDDDTKAEAIESLDAPIPDMKVGDLIADLKKRNKYGTIFGETAFTHPTVTVTISKDEADVQFFAGDNGRSSGLYANGEAPDYPYVRTALPPATVQPIFGLDDSSDPDEYKTKLVGEKILIHGTARIVDRKTRKHFEDDHIEGEWDDFVANVDAFLVGYRENPEGGPKLRRLDMNKLQKAHADQDFTNGIEVGPYLVQDVREDKPGELALYVTSFATDKEGKPKLVPVEGKTNPDGSAVQAPVIQLFVDGTEATFEVKRGKNKGTDFVRNKGAFAVFLNHRTPGATGIDRDFLAELVAAAPPVQVQLNATPAAAAPAKAKPSGGLKAAAKAE